MNNFFDGVPASFSSRARFVLEIRSGVASISNVSERSSLSLGDFRGVVVNKVLLALSTRSGLSESIRVSRSLKLHGLPSVDDISGVSTTFDFLGDLLACQPSLGYSKYSVLADRHVSRRLVTPNNQYWLIDMSAIAWLLQIFSTG